MTENIAYSVGTKVRGPGSGSTYTVESVDEDFRVVVSHSGTKHTLSLDSISWWPLIAPAPVENEVEYVVRVSDTEVDVYYVKREAIVAANAIKNYCEKVLNNVAWVGNVKIFERPVKPVEKEIVF